MYPDSLNLVFLFFEKLFNLVALVSSKDGRVLFSIVYLGDNEIFSENE
jgi:hypothetical protein